MASYLDDLNAAQRAPVECLEGPLMVIAGAGSGKTRVLTYRIAHLMNNGVDPFNILALTFTNKAAREMKERIGKMVGRGEAKNLWMGTFHSVFARILRAEASRLGYPSNFTIYDTQDSQRLINQIIKEMGLDKDVYKYKEIQARISHFKNNLITVKAYQQRADFQEEDNARMRPRTGEVYQEYVDRCFKAGAMDFDDLLLRTNELLTRFPDVLAKYQDRFRHLLVDEYQDTNHSQYLIIRALADRFQNICVVGDDAQSIYAFRGANIRNILNFQKDYDGAKVFKLEQNYRSSGNIVDAASCIIAHNREQLPKTVFTENAPGGAIKVVNALTDNEEAQYIANTIFDAQMRDQLFNKDFCILYRTNAQSRALEDALRKKNIKYRIWGGLSFYQRKEIKDILCYLRLTVNSKDEEALLRIINYPKRAIGDTTINKLTIAANHYKRSIYEVIQNIDRLPQLKINAGTRRKLSDFVTLIESFKAKVENADAFEAADYITKKSGLVRELNKDTTPEGISRYENVQELINGIKNFVEVQGEEKDGDPSLTAFLEDVALATDMDKDDGDHDRVALMTVHMAKGLEFPHVFISGMEENLFPSMMSVNSRADLEEERRLFYVALTRAEKQAYLTYAEQRYRWGKLTDGEISRFIEEIDEKYMEFTTARPRGGRPSYNKFVDADIFDSPKMRKAKPTPGKAPEPTKLTRIRTYKPSVPSNGDFEGEVLLDLAVGDRIEHQRFGKGSVVELEGIGSDKKATIKFEETGKRKLLLKFAKLKRL